MHATFQLRWAKRQSVQKQLAHDTSAVTVATSATPPTKAPTNKRRKLSRSYTSPCRCSYNTIELSETRSAKSVLLLQDTGGCPASPSVSSTSSSAAAPPSPTPPSSHFPQNTTTNNPLLPPPPHSSATTSLFCSAESTARKQSQRAVIIGEGNAGQCKYVASLVQDRGDVVGRGAAGVVWACRRAPTVVLKEIDMRNEVGNELGNTSGFSEIRSLWHCIVARSEDHVVRLHAWALLGTTLWMVLENCDQGSLASYVQKHGPLPTHLIRHFTRNIASAVESISAIGKVHCDIKPANILVCKSLEEGLVLKLGDLGSAVDCEHAQSPRSARGSVSSESGSESLLDGAEAENGSNANEPSNNVQMASEGVTHGTNFYQAPEAVVGRTSSTSDVFGAGASVYFMATGKAPLSPSRPERKGRSEQELGAEWINKTGMAYMSGGRYDKLDAELAKFRSEQKDDDLADLVETWMGFRPSERPDPLSPGFRRHSFLLPQEQQSATSAASESPVQKCESASAKIVPPNFRAHSARPDELDWDDDDGDDVYDYSDAGGFDEVDEGLGDSLSSINFAALHLRRTRSVDDTPSSPTCNDTF